MSSQTLEQVRARYALKQIQKHVPAPGKKPDDDTKAYATRVRSIPTMVLQNGLGQAMAFLLADAAGDLNKPSGRLYQEIQDWLCGPRDKDWPERVYIGSSDLMQALFEGTRSEYQRAQEVSLALLAWMRKFADAYLGKGEDS